MDVTLSPPPVPSEALAPTHTVVVLANFLPLPRVPTPVRYPSGPSVPFQPTLTEQTPREMIASVTSTWLPANYPFGNRYHKLERLVPGPPSLRRTVTSDRAILASLIFSASAKFENFRARERNLCNGRVRIWTRPASKSAFSRTTSVATRKLPKITALHHCCREITFQKTHVLNMTSILAGSPFVTLHFAVSVQPVTTNFFFAGTGGKLLRSSRNQWELIPMLGGISGFWSYS